MPKETSRASVRTEVQPALSPSGLRIEAHPTGMSIPHGDYRPRVNPNTQLISQAFNTLAQVGSEVARKQIVAQREADIALGTQARLEAGDSANREADIMDKSTQFIRGYDLMSGKLGAAQATSELYDIYNENPDAFVTQSMVQNMVANRIATDLQGVTSPEMRTAYLEGMMSVEAELTAKNAKHQAVVAHTEQLDNFSAVVNQTFSVGVDVKSAQDLATDKAAMRELGLMNGLSSAEINKVLVSNIGQIAVETGRPELLDAFDIATQDTDDPEKTVPGLSTSTTFGPAIAEFKAKAERAKKSFEASQLEGRQNAFFKAFDAETNSALKDRMIDENIENGLISAEKGRELRKEMNKQRDSADLSGAINDLATAGDYAGIDRLVAEGLLKPTERNKILDARASQLLTFFHSNIQNNPTEAQQALRLMTRDLEGTGRKSDVLSRELNPSADNFTAFQNSVAMANTLKAQGASGRAVVADHQTQDQRNRMMIYEAQVNNGHPPEEAYSMARSYGTPEAIEQGNKMLGSKRDKELTTLIDKELGSYDPGVFSWEYDMTNTAQAKDEIMTNARVAVVNSGGQITPEDAYEAEIERFKDTHLAYRAEGAETGVWVPVPPGVDQDAMQDALDWYGGQIANELGYAEGTSFYPEFQPGVGYVMRNATTHGIVTRTGTDANGNPLTVPVSFSNVADLLEAHSDSQFMTPEEAQAEQAARQAGRYAGRTRGPQVDAQALAAKRNEVIETRRRREEARKAVMAVAERNAQRSREAIDERFGFTPKPGRRSRGRRGRAAGAALAATVAATGVGAEPVAAIDQQTRASIQRHEGAGKPGKPGVAYNDSLGLRTVGYGTLLEDPENKGQWLPGRKQALEELGVDPQAVWDGKVKLNQEQMNVLFEEHYQKANTEAAKVAGQLPPEAHSIVTEMVYQMGLPRVLKFEKMRAALKAGDYKKAAAEMLDSRWAKQTPRRAKELASRMRNI